MIRVAYEPPLPIPDPPMNSGGTSKWQPVSGLVEGNPQAFVGLYRDHRGGGPPVVVFNQGIDEDAWRARLDAAAGALPFQVETCTRSGAELREVQEELAGRSWSPNARSIAFGVSVDPATCTVRLDSDQLTPADIPGAR